LHKADQAVHTMLVHVLDATLPGVSS